MPIYVCITEGCIWNTLRDLITKQLDSQQANSYYSIKKLNDFTHENMQIPNNISMALGNENYCRNLKALQ